MNQTRFTLRVHNILIKKLKVISERNGRSINKEIEQILKWVIEDYENKCGRIKQEEYDNIDMPKLKENSPLKSIKKDPMDMLFKP